MEVENGKRSLGTMTEEGAQWKKGEKVNEKMHAGKIKKEHNVDSNLLTDIVLHDIG